MFVYDPSDEDNKEYSNKFQHLANECLVMIANCVKPKIGTYNITTTEEYQLVEFPSDFISFNNMKGIKDGVCFTIPQYTKRNTVILPEIGTYTLYYNALWDAITEENVNTDNELEIDTSILYVLPTYIVYNILAQDDIQRSVIMKNDFEILLSRLDNTILYQSDSFESEWI